MFDRSRVVVVMPAYNAAQTIRETHAAVCSEDVVDHIIIVDDASDDETVEIAAALPRTTLIVHEENLGYGGNQKSCYRAALEEGADIVIMVHPDYQYTPLLIPAMAALIGRGLYHCVLGSRILGGGALTGGMPRWKYFGNRILTLAENIMLGSKLSEFHTGYRAFSRRLLQNLDLSRNSNDFVFDNQMLAQILWAGYFVGEISCPTRYFPEASSINFSRSLKYGIGCLLTSVEYRLSRLGLYRSPRFRK